MPNVKWPQTNLKSSRRDSVKIARRFNTGIELQCASSPAGTAEHARPFLPSLRDSVHFAAQPGVETPGYCRSPLRGGGIAQINNFLIAGAVGFDYNNQLNKTKNILWH
jgi:hypothetical protein